MPKAKQVVSKLPAQALVRFRVPDCCHLATALTDRCPVLWKPKVYCGLLEFHGIAIGCTLIMFSYNLAAETFWVHPGLLECLGGNYWMHCGTIVGCMLNSRDASGQLLGTS